MSTRPRRPAGSEPGVPDPPRHGPAAADYAAADPDAADPVTPVSPGGWDTRSWTLLDDPHRPGPPHGASGTRVYVRADPEARPGGVPPAGTPSPAGTAGGAGSGAGPVTGAGSREGAVEVVWPEAGEPADAHVVDATHLPDATCQPEGEARPDGGVPPAGRRRSEADGGPDARRPGPDRRSGAGGPSEEGPPEEDEAMQDDRAGLFAPPDPASRRSTAELYLPLGPGRDPAPPAPPSSSADARRPGVVRPESASAARADGSADGSGPRTRSGPRRRADAPARGGAARPGGGASTAPRGSADPVRELMHRHRELCEHAVDPLEIAAALEAHGLTDRAAARFRHRDVFSLAEELYARVPRAGQAPAADPSADPAVPSARAVPEPPRRRAAALARGVVPLLPGALCAATLAGLAGLGGSGVLPGPEPYVRLAVGTAGALAVVAALGPALRGLPRTGVTVLWACWLLGYALYGDWLLAELLSDAPRTEGAVPALAGRWVPLALAFGIAPTVWGVRMFAVRARRTLAGSRSLGEFAARVRPLLALTVVLVTASLVAVQAAARLALPAAGTAATGVRTTQAATVALGLLLFAALLLAAHGFPRAASAGTGAACVMHAAALGSVLAGRWPGAEPAGRPVAYAVAAYGPAVVPAAACTLAALALLAHAFHALAGASAHQGSAPGGREGW